MVNLNEFRFRYNLIDEMYIAVDVIRNYNPKLAQSIFNSIAQCKSLLLTGEGSSRIFPARNAIFHRMQMDNGPMVFTESSNDLLGKNLSNHAVIGASNSGRTKELINLFMQLEAKKHEQFFGVTCSQASLLEVHAKGTVVVPGGGEKAVAATKSVVAQALFYDLLIGMWTGVSPNLDRLANDFEQALNSPFNPSIAQMLCEAEHIYFAGVNNGVAEELTLKTNEIVRKKSAYFPGSYLLHGVEEVVTAHDVVVLVDYMPDHAEKIRKVFVDTIGAKVIAFSTEQTIFPTVKLSYTDLFFTSYIKLAAGWKLLAEAGLAMNINLDKPERARKVGNEFQV